MTLTSRRQHSRQINSRMKRAAQQHRHHNRVPDPTRREGVDDLVNRRRVQIKKREVHGNIRPLTSNKRTNRRRISRRPRIPTPMRNQN
ncbi:hypothetical protein GCM10011591_38530 [Nocardia camponoti]|uniref:Uncharacterized protein n=1 Tax=Nocardia camponoti TaxID=1616106 RepID=A0A917QQ42_9NOCA|nr:hypothetical protein GCM10011591_38530 [Nocardia camponoti]